MWAVLCVKLMPQMQSEAVYQTSETFPGCDLSWLSFIDQENKASLLMLEVFVFFFVMEEVLTSGFLTVAVLCHC